MNRTIQSMKKIIEIHNVLKLFKKKKILSHFSERGQFINSAVT